MSYLLDTHVLIRWVQGGRDLSRAQRRALDAADAEHPLLVSEITLWEIASLASLGRLRVLGPLRDWLELAVAPPLVHTLGITPSIAAEVASLPASVPRDPGDRILVATARVHRAVLVTSDRRLLAAGAVPTLE